MNKKIATDVAKLLLKIKAVTFRFDPPYTFTSGIKSPVYTDNRLIMSYPKVRDEIIAATVKTIEKEIGRKNIDWLSATATAAIPMGAWLAYKLNLPMVFVRSDKKGHGKENKMEGMLKKKARVLIVEDLISTGGSAIDNVLTIREEGGMVNHIIANISWGMAKAEAAFKANKVQLFTLSSRDILIDYAFKQKLFNKKQRDMIYEWFEDPAGWGEKYHFN